MGGYYIPYWNILYNIGEPLSAILVNIFYFGFVMALLDMKKYHQKWYNYFFIVIIINVLFLVIHCIVFFFPFNLFKSFDVYGYFRIYQFLTSLLILYFLRWQQPQYLFWGSLSVIFFSSITILTHIWAHFDEDIEIYIKAADSLFYLGILIEVFCFSISIGYRIFTLKQEKIRYEESFNMFKSDLHTSIVNGLNNLTWDLDDKFNNEFDKEKTLKKAKDLLMKSKDLLNADTLKNKTIEDILKFDYKIEDLEVKKIKIDFDIDEETAATINAKSNTVKQHIYLIYSEVINNIIKYAKCQHISVHLGFEKKGTLKYMKLIVADDGIGFDKTLKTGNGLGLIEWHAQQLNGSIEISSEIKKGTKVCLLFTATRPTLNKFKK